MRAHKPNTAALYLRSSKDRSDVSIEAQRHELTRFAAEQGWSIVAEFVDVVESGKEENRPGLIALVDELKSRSRAWHAVIAFDTARIARRRFIAVNFEHECEQRGVRVLYKNMAGIDPETEVLILSVFQGMDPRPRPATLCRWRRARAPRCFVPRRDPCIIFAA